MAQSVYSSWSLVPCQLSSWVESPHFQTFVACQKLPSVINPRSISLGFAIRRGSEGRKAMASYAGIRRGPGSLSMAKGLVAEEEETKHSLEKNTWLHKDYGDLELSELTAISPLDGRYASRVKELRPILSEYGLIRYRVIVEPALPTTLGKEMANFCFRLSEQRQKVAEVRLLGKMAGAVGNYNAHLVAYPAVPWQKVAEEFVTSLGIGFNPYTTQVNEPRISEDLEQYWEVLAEPIQTEMEQF